MSSLKAVILAGGFATRLRPLSCARPKALFPVVNKPLLEWIFERLHESSVDEAIMAVNALTQFHIKQQKIPKHGLKIRFSIDPPKKPLGTAGPVKKAETLIGHDEPFMVLNGDIFADLKYSELIRAHKKTGALATIALCKVDDPSRYGVADLAENNQIKRFIEKPAKHQAPTNLINAGIYVLSPKVFDYIPKGQAVSMEREVFPKLAAEGKLFGCTFNGLWIDIGKPQDYLEANKIVLDSMAGKLKQKKPAGFELKQPVAMDKGVKISKGAVVGPYAFLGKNVTVGVGAQISNSVIFPDAKIGDGAVINGALIGENAAIGHNVKIKKGCVVADHAKIKGNLELKEDSAICPGKEITETF